VFQNRESLFLRKKSVPQNLERVPEWNGQESILLFMERFFFLKKAFTFLERVFGDYHLHPHSIKEYSKRSK